MLYNNEELILKTKKDALRMGAAVTTAHLLEAAPLVVEFIHDKVGIRYEKQINDYENTGDFLNSLGDDLFSLNEPGIIDKPVELPDWIEYWYHLNRARNVLTPGRHQAMIDAARHLAESNDPSMLIYALFNQINHFCKKNDVDREIIYELITDGIRYNRLEMD